MVRNKFFKSPYKSDRHDPADHVTNTNPLQVSWRTVAPLSSGWCLVLSFRLNNHLQGRLVTQCESRFEPRVPFQQSFYYTKSHAGYGNSVVTSLHAG